LAILDTSSVGNQPMVSADGRYVIVLNGEIYNFRELRETLPTPSGGWRTRTDTEVVLESFRQWGAGCLPRFRGMFAFAIWDCQDRKLFVARDRLGVKPLYYAHSPNQFLFASRPAALLATGLVDGGTDPQALRFYFDVGFIPAPWSLHRGIRKLQPGHYVEYSKTGFSDHCYWSLTAISPDESLVAAGVDALVDQLRERIDVAVESRTISDVPIGAFLSGGIDSSLVVSALARRNAGVKAFSLGFDEAAFDESPAARSVATAIGCELVVEKLSSAALLDLLPRYLEAFDEPLFDSSAFAVMAIARLARRSVTVALTGDGGDELLGGYHYYPLLKRLASVYRLGPGIRSTLSTALGLLPGHRMKLASAALSLDDWVAGFGFMRGIQKDFEPLGSRELNRNTISFTELLRSALSVLPRGLSPHDYAMRLDAMYTLPDAYLQKVDVATMAFSLEAREPLLDHELVEWAMRLPVNWKVRERSTKWLARRLVATDIGASAAHQPKKGFSVPIDQWLRGPLRDWAGDQLHSSSRWSDLPIDHSAVLRAHGQHLSGERNTHPLLWGLLMLGSVTSARASEP
jgi:asparagine synthase (glutamine-hydrolysing)